MGPLVSVGIPTYNRPRGVQRTLEQITTQTYRNLEIIVSDNCSPTPEIKNIVEKFKERDPRIKFFRQIHNLGMSLNFKFVLKKATGAYFMWAADDDEWDPQFIETCVKSLGSASSCMTGFKILNRARNKLIQSEYPPLSPAYSPYKNASIFLRKTIANLFYGLHRREEILYYLADYAFDFYDCYFCLKQILTNGFVINPKTLFTAGIDNDQNNIKPFHPKKNKCLEYWPFYYSSLKLITSSNRLKFGEKINLIGILTLDVLHYFILYEKNRRAKYVQMFIIFFEQIQKRILNSKFLMRFI